MHVGVPHIEENKEIGVEREREREREREVLPHLREIISVCERKKKLERFFFKSDFFSLRRKNFHCKYLYSYV